MHTWIQVRHAVGLLILPLYFVVTLLIGWVARGGERTPGAFLNARRSLPLGVVVAAYLAANCGALEIVGLSAMAAQYGVQAMMYGVFSSHCFRIQFRGEP